MIPPSTPPPSSNDALQPTAPTALSARGERHVLWLFMAIQFTLILDFMLLMPLGPELMGQLELSATSFGALVSCYSISSAVCGFSGAFWLDRVPRRRLLLSLYLLFVLATATCAVANGALLLTCARVVAGGAAGLLWAGVLACIIDLVAPERRGDAIGLVMSSYAVAAVLGVPLGLFAAAQLGWRAPFGLLALVSATLCVLLQRALAALPAAVLGAKRSADAGARTHRLGLGAITRTLEELFQPTFVTGWLLSFWVVSAGFLLIPYLGTFLTKNLSLTPQQLAWVYLIGGSTTFVTSRLVGRAVDTKGPALCLGLLLVCTWLPHFGLTHMTEGSFVQLALAFTLFMTLTSGRMIPTLALITERVAPSLRGRFLAVNTAVTDTAAGIASAAGGVLLTTLDSGALIGFGHVGILACAVSLLALGALALHLRSRHPGARLAEPVEPA